jgi:hypothetical protein
MKIQLAPNIPLAIVLFAAVATVALRAAARRLELRWAPGTEPGQATVTADQARPRPAVIGRAAGPPDRPADAAEQTQQVFHELHANGRNVLCAVCDGQYVRV